MLTVIVWMVLAIVRLDGQERTAPRKCALGSALAMDSASTGRVFATKLIVATIAPC